LCGCCDNRVGGDKPEPAEFFFKKRGCTDCLCFLLFLVFWGGLGYLSYLSVTVGDPYEILYGADYLGNRCGRNEFKDRKKVYFPRIDKDIEAQAAIAYTMPWKVAFYGLCVDQCPNVSQPTACFDNPSHCIVNDYGTQAQYSAAGGSAYYYATMPSLDLLNRCIPQDSNSLTQDPDRCAFPQCDNVNYYPCDETYPTTWKMEYPRSLQCEVVFRKGEIQQLRTTARDTLSRAIGNHVQGVVRVVESFLEAYVEVLCFGLAMPIVCGFVWLILLRLFAGVIIYTLIILLGFAMVVFTAYCFLLAGAFDSLFSANITLGVSNTSVPSWANDTLAMALGLVNDGVAIVSVAKDATTDALAAGADYPWVWYIVGGISALVTFMYLLSMCLARKKIKVAVALVKETTMVIKARPSTMFFPFFTLVGELAFLCFFVLLAAFLATADLNKSHFTDPASVALRQGASYLERLTWYNETILKDGAEGIESIDSSSTWVQVCVYLYVLFGILWTLECVSNISWTAMSGSVSHWYFFREDTRGKTRIPLLRSLGRVLRYHLGSIAFGSFIIAVVRLIRIILMVIDRYTKNQQKKNWLLSLTIKCCQCCMYCLEKTLKFITDYAYIYIALQGSSFCFACFSTFSLIINNPAQLAINNLVRTVLAWLQLIALPVGCGWLGNVIIVANNRAQPMYATILIAIAAFIIARAYSVVFGCVLDTLFVCTVRDKNDYAGQYMPANLRKAFGFDKKDRKKDGEGGGEGGVDEAKDLVAK